MNTTFFREMGDLGGSGGGMSEIEKEAEAYAHKSRNSIAVWNGRYDGYLEAAKKYQKEIEKLKAEIIRLTPDLLRSNPASLED